MTLNRLYFPAVFLPVLVCLGWLPIAVCGSPDSLPAKKKPQPVRPQLPLPPETMTDATTDSSQMYSSSMVLDFLILNHDVTLIKLPPKKPSEEIKKSRPRHHDDWELEILIIEEGCKALYVLEAPTLPSTHQEFRDLIPEINRYADSLYGMDTTKSINHVHFLNKLKADSNSTSRIILNHPGYHKYFAFLDTIQQRGYDFIWKWMLEPERRYADLKLQWVKQIQHGTNTQWRAVSPMMDSVGHHLVKQKPYEQYYELHYIDPHDSSLVLGYDVPAVPQGDPILEMQLGGNTLLSLNRNACDRVNMRISLFAADNVTEAEVASCLRNDTLVIELIPVSPPGYCQQLRMERRDSLDVINKLTDAGANHHEICYHNGRILLKVAGVLDATKLSQLSFPVFCQNAHHKSEIVQLDFQMLDCWAEILRISDNPDSTLPWITSIPMIPDTTQPDSGTTLMPCPQDTTPEAPLTVTTTPLQEATAQRPSTASVELTIPVDATPQQIIVAELDPNLDDDNDWDNNPFPGIDLDSWSSDINPGSASTGGVAFAVDRSHSFDPGASAEVNLPFSQTGGGTPGFSIDFPSSGGGFRMRQHSDCNNCLSASSTVYNEFGGYLIASAVDHPVRLEIGNDCLYCDGCCSDYDPRESFLVVESFHQRPLEQSFCGQSNNNIHDDLAVFSSYNTCTFCSGQRVDINLSPGLHTLRMVDGPSIAAFAMANDARSVLSADVVLDLQAAIASDPFENPLSCALNSNPSYNYLYHGFIGGGGGVPVSPPQPGDSVPKVQVPVLEQVCGGVLAETQILVVDSTMLRRGPKPDPSHEEIDLNVYPNPVRSGSGYWILDLEINTPGWESLILEARLTNTFGQQVGRFPLMQGQNLYPAGHLAPGMYLLSVPLGPQAQPLTFKLIVR